MRCRKVFGHQRRLAWLLAEVCQCPKVPLVVWSDLLAFLVCFRHLYHVATRSYWMQKYFLESHVPEHQNIFEGWHIVNLSRVRPLDRVKYHSDYAARCIQYEPPNLLIALLPFVLASYSGVTKRGSASDQTRVRIIALTEYIFMRRGCVP